MIKPPIYQTVMTFAVGLLLGCSGSLGPLSAQQGTGSAAKARGKSGEAAPPAGGATNPGSPRGGAAGTAGTGAASRQSGGGADPLQHDKLLAPGTANLPPVNPATGQGLDPQTGEVVRGTLTPLPGEKPLSALPGSKVNMRVMTADGVAASYFFPGNTVFVEATGLKPTTKHRVLLKWPNGVESKQEFTADEAGNMQGPQGKFVEYPHTGFYNVAVTPGKSVVVTGEFVLQLIELESNLQVGQVNFAVRKGPIVFAVGLDKPVSNPPVYKQRAVYFADFPEEVFLHGEGFQPGQKVVVNMVMADVNRLKPMADGLTIADKVVDPFRDMAFEADANGIFDKKVIAWFKREPVKDSMVIISKFLNDMPTFVRSEDIAITDHPTFLIKDSQEFFAAAGVKAGELPPAQP
ncbi:MAG: hypothetical protein VKP62_06235 [Candidatus Sericytochromatia bacterium]|nr:hypothetical protein [Candidatus Sericytochromatia bacterium]